MVRFSWFAFFFIAVVLETANGSKPPNIVLTVIDDLGWSDVGFQGSVIHTPNINRLAAEGVILDNYYVQPMCTPTRSTLMTGRYPIHTGLQHSVILPSQPYGLPLNFKTLPETLQDAGYATHMVGKWHLGFFEWSYTPTYRGFESFYGFYTDMEDHFEHERLGILDLRDDTLPVRDKDGTYSANLFTKQAVQVIMEHNSSRPLFLYLPFQNVHGPVQAPQKYIDKYSFIENKTRRTYAAMLDIVDEAIGNVTRSLEKAGPVVWYKSVLSKAYIVGACLVGILYFKTLNLLNLPIPSSAETWKIVTKNVLWDNTLFIFTTDNGGRPKSGGYNWPLRGQKGSLLEGGVRGVAFVHGPMLKKTGVKSKELLHSTDWYPTLINLAGKKEGGRVDGFDVWETISTGKPSPRTEILLNIDLAPKEKRYRGMESIHPYYQGAAIRVADMKLLVSCPNSTWFKPPELYNKEMVIISFYHFQNSQVKGFIEVALYNITADPTEHNDLSQKLPDVVQKLQERLEFYKRSAVTPLNKPTDSQAWDVARKDSIWTPWRSTVGEKA
ncbi:unnamed protein product [Porites lobata]|uniref:Sulfatase N-terminal domain-containing protein n=1 Tax=Porites lobata TaxID=104759 RepID=A0ABN8S990_9CNID|nr:unnamed protein product [Porites lobata]